MEFIKAYVQNVKIDLKGEKLIGDIDSSYGRLIELFPEDPELKTILNINTSIMVVDNFGNELDAQSELIVNIYNYEKNMNIEEIYGLFCYATIHNFMVLRNGIVERKISHDDNIFIPHMIIPDFDVVEKEIKSEMNRVYRQ